MNKFITFVLEKIIFPIIIVGVIALIISASYSQGYFEKIKIFYFSHIISIAIFVVGNILLYGIESAIFNSIKEKHPKSAASAAVILMCAPLVISFTFFSALYNNNMLTLSSAFIAVLITSIGWWLESLSKYKSTKEKNTLDIIINMRSNPIYNDNVVKSEIFLPRNFYIKKELCHFFANQEKYIEDNSNQTCYFRSQLENMLSCVHILNHYEFISKMISTRQLDEDLIKECYNSAFIEFEKQTCHLISQIRNIQPDAYHNYRQLILKWSGSLYSDECRTDPNSEKMNEIGVGIPIKTFK